MKPASRQNEVFVNKAGLLAISLQAAPEDGQANKMLIKYLAKLLRIQQKKITIQYGAASRNKVISLDAPPEEQEAIILCLLQVLKV